MTTTIEPFIVPIEDVPKVTEWYRTRGGVLRWSNLEIGNSRPDTITPRMTESGAEYVKPHWAYGNPQPVSPDELRVSVKKPCTIPPEWFPVCDCCNGTGRRALQTVATARKVSLDEMRQLWDDEIWGPIGDDDCFACNYCKGTGHIIKPVRGRVKRQYWGLDVTDSSAARFANRLAKYYGLVMPTIASPSQDTIRYDWQGIGNGLVEFSFYVEHIEAFPTI